nr:uncharacterized protein LOC111425380 [Onthophagus taurus]
MDITQLPTEILEIICSYLDTPDVLNLRQVHPRFVYVSTSRCVISHVNVTNCYHFNKVHLENFLVKNPTCLHITSLNLTSIYWISAYDLRKNIMKLLHLKELYVIDTKLGLRKSDVTVYRALPSLERLGVTILRRTFCKEVIQHLPKLTHFYFHIESFAVGLLHLILHTLGKFNPLAELWIIEIGLPTIHDWKMISLPRNVQDITTLAINFACVRDTILANNLTKMFVSHVRDQFAVYKRLDVTMPMLWDRQYEDVNWLHLLRLRRCSSPFSRKQFNELFYDHSKLGTMMFDELNFIHHSPTCTDNYHEHIRNILLYENSRELQKTALNMCAALHDAEFNIPQPTKRPRIGNGIPAECLLSRLATNTPHLTELELWGCARTVNTVYINNTAIENIANFKKLEKLTIDEIPHLISGVFLTKILQECKSLVSLRIRSKTHNTKLHFMLCNALPYAKTLQDLRYEHPCNISIDRLFTALANSLEVRLKRLYIKCRSVEVISAKPFENFLEKNPQLIFLCLQISNLPQTSIKKLLDALKRFKNDPRKVFVLVKSDEQLEGNVQIPHVHFNDMIKLSSRVSVIDVFKDFDH